MWRKWTWLSSLQHTPVLPGKPQKYCHWVCILWWPTQYQAKHFELWFRGYRETWKPSSAQWPASTYFCAGNPGSLRVPIGFSSGDRFPSSPPPLGVEHPTSVGWMTAVSASSLPTFRAHAYLSHSLSHSAVQQASWDVFSSFSLNVLVPTPLMFSSMFLLLSILVISMSNCWPSNTQASQFFEYTFFHQLCLWCFLRHLFPWSRFKPVITSNCSFSIISVPGLTLWSPPATLRVLSFWDPNFSDSTPFSWPLTYFMSSLPSSLPFTPWTVIHHCFLALIVSPLPPTAVTLSWQNPNLSCAVVCGYKKVIGADLFHFKFLTAEHSCPISPTPGR